MSLLTTKEAAVRLGIHSESVATAIRRSKLKAQKRGRDYLIEEAEVERYAIQYGRKSKAAEPPRAGASLSDQV